MLSKFFITEIHPRPTEIFERLNLFPRENDKWAVTDNVFTFLFYYYYYCVSVYDLYVAGACGVHVTHVPYHTPHVKGQLSETFLSF